MKTILSYLLLAGLFLTACDKDPTKKGYQRKPPKPEFYRFRLGEAKDYLWAKKGSYWIYKQTITGDLDTQTVTGFSFDSVISKGTLDYSKHITVEYDRLSRSILSSFNQWIYNDQTGKYSANSMRPLKTGINRLGGASTNVPFFHPFIIDDWSGTGSSVTTCKSFDSTMFLQGKTYYHVVKFDIDIDGIWETKLNCIRPNTIYYWAKDVGLIKKEMNRCGYSWELIDYKIIK